MEGIASVAWPHAFSLSGEDIRQKFNALSISIDRDVTAKMTQSDTRTFFQWYIVYFIKPSDRIEKKIFDNSNYFHLSAKVWVVECPDNLIIQ